MSDHQEFLDVAKEIIRDEGREIILSNLDPDSVVIDKPWLGATDARDPLNTTSTTIFAVNVPLSSASSLGIRSETIELYKDTTSLFIAEPGEDTPEDFDQYQVVTDGTQEFQISFIEKLKPGNLTLLYYIGVTT